MILLVKGEALGELKELSRFLESYYNFTIAKLILYIVFILMIIYLQIESLFFPNYFN